jgi:hypothetical protein
MIDPNGMTVLNGIQNLQKGVLGKCVASNNMASFGDIGEQVRTQLQQTKSGACPGQVT